jgi:hypothetical protein
MGYPGHPQQNWQGYQQPPMGYAEPQAGPGLAVTSGIVGLGVAGVLLTQTLLLLSDLSAAPELPTGWTIMNIAHFAIVGIALLGAILVFVRQLAGAFLLMFSAVLTIAAMVLDPLLAHSLYFSMLGALPDFEPSGEFGNYFSAMFEFGNGQAVLRAAALALGVLLLIISALPPALNWLRGSDRNAHHPYSQGW